MHNNVIKRLRLNNVIGFLFFLVHKKLMIKFPPNWKVQLSEKFLYDGIKEAILIDVGWSVFAKILSKFSFP